MTDSQADSSRTYGMDVKSEPRILAADRVANSLVIEFDDGKCALFPASLLHDTIPQAVQINESEDDQYDA